LIIEASLGHKHSYAWMNILSARPLLQQWLIWRVGDGRSVWVWGDQWLPTPTTFSVQSPRRLLGENNMVADFIDQDTKGWKTELVREVFLEEEAMIIFL